MTPNVYLVGGYSTPFGKMPERSYKQLTAEAVTGAISDAGLDDGQSIDRIWFGSAAMAAWGQGSVRGQVCLGPLFRDGYLAANTPVTNVENACATSTAALYCAWVDIVAGQSRIALVAAADKLIPPPGAKPDLSGLAAGIDQQDPDEWLEMYRQAGTELGKPFETGADRSLFMDMDALQAIAFMKRTDVTPEHLAITAAKTHNYGALNPRAQYRFTMTPDQVLADRPVSWPLTRAMCAPVGDGAAALVLCHEDVLAELPAAVRERAIRIRTCTIAGGSHRGLQQQGLSEIVAQRAYSSARLTPADIDLAEVHDATAYLEVYQVAALGFAPKEEAGRYVADGQTGPGGRTPINTSGGLLSKGHPIGPTGASMIFELMVQLRGEAGPRQVSNPRIGLAENSGGIVGFDHAVSAITILEKA